MEIVTKNTDCNLTNNIMENFRNIKVYCCVYYCVLYRDVDTVAYHGVIRHGDLGNMTKNFCNLFVFRSVNRKKFKFLSKFSSEN